MVYFYIAGMVQKINNFAKNLALMHFTVHFYTAYML